MGRKRPDPEVPQWAKRRAFTARYKPDVMAGYDAAPDGQKGALPRREGLSCGPIIGWRRARAAGALAGLKIPRGGNPRDERDERIVRLQAEKKGPEQEPARARLVMDRQARPHALVEALPERADTGPRWTP